MAEASLIDVEGENRDSTYERDLYGCTSCSEKIPNTKARIFCSRCLNYHICTNCFVIKSYAKPHIDSHPTKIFTQSGFFVPGALAVSSKPAIALPSKPKVAEEDKIEIPVADWGLLWNIMKAPLQKKAPKSSEKDDVTVDPKDVTGVGMSGGLGNMPPSPPRSVNLLDDTILKYPMPETWEPLFAADSTPTAVFIALMSTIFVHLDSSHTGYLSPETYSGFLDTQGYQWNANVCKWIKSV